MKKGLRALVLIAVVLLAGCAAKPAVQDDDMVAPAQAPVVEPLKPGAIRGFVITPSVEPVRDANVTLLGINQTTRTSATGLFFFNDVPEGRHLMHVEREGFTAKTVATLVERNRVFEINVTLLPKVDLEPYQESIELKGLIACQVILQTPGDGGHAARREAQSCGDADPNHKTVWEVEVGPEATGAIVEELWDAQSPLVSHLDLLVETMDYGDMNAELGYTHAERGYGRIEIPGDAFRKYYPEGGRMRVETQVGPSMLDDESTANVGAAVQQDLTIYITVFYAQDVPPGFTVIKKEG